MGGDELREEDAGRDFLSSTSSHIFKWMEDFEGAPQCSEIDLKEFRGAISVQERWFLFSFRIGAELG